MKTKKSKLIEELVTLLRPPKSAKTTFRKHCNSQSETFLAKRLLELKSSIR